MMLKFLVWVWLVLNLIIFFCKMFHIAEFYSFLILIYILAQNSTSILL